MASMILYSYSKSSSAFRVRIALNLKSIAYDIHAVNLLPDNTGGQAENWHEDYLSINPQGLVPALSVDEQIISQSSAIMEYLEEVYPETPLLPENTLQRAYVRSLVQIISCDIQPLNNLRVLDYLKTQFNCNKTQIDQWYSQWISEGLTAFEKQLNTHSHQKGFCAGDKPGLADAFLIPQLYNARRYQCDISHLKQCTFIEKNCLTIRAFQDALPENQADYIT